MRRLSVMTLLVLHSSATLAGQSNQDSRQSADKSNVQTRCSFNEEERQIAIQLKNPSKAGLILYWDGPLASNTVSMEDSDGKPVPYAQAGKFSQLPLPPLKDGELRVFTSSMQTITLQPGEERTEVIPIDLLFVVPKEGGLFRVLAGRRLENFNEEAHKFEDRKTLWCEPMTIRLSPLDK